MWRPFVVALLLLGALAAGCSKESSPPFALDGSPRVPDDEGVVTSADFKHITLDGKRTYKVSESLAAFSTYTLKAVPLLGRLQQYVQIGVKGKTMVWLASIGSVVKASPGGADRDRVLYTGIVRRRLDDEHLMFRGGTVVRVRKGSVVPAAGRQVRAEIDPSTHVAALVPL
jgi:hypothetical protein